MSYQLFGMFGLGFAPTYPNVRGYYEGTADGGRVAAIDVAFDLDGPLGKDPRPLCKQEHERMMSRQPFCRTVETTRGGSGLYQGKKGE